MCIPIMTCELWAYMYMCVHMHLLHLVNVLFSVCSENLEICIYTDAICHVKLFKENIQNYRNPLHSDISFLMDVVLAVAYS